MLETWIKSPMIESRLCSLSILIIHRSDTFGGNKYHFRQFSTKNMGRIWARQDRSCFWQCQAD